MPVSIGISLKEDSTGRIFGSVGGNCEGGGEVRRVKDRLQEEEAFQGVEGGLTRGEPIPSQIFLSEVNQGASDI